MSSFAYDSAASVGLDPARIPRRTTSIAWNRSWPVGRVLRRRSAAAFTSSPLIAARARPYAAVAPIAGAPRTTMSSIASATSSTVRASWIRNSNGRARWSMSFTIPSSSQTVRTSRTSPSTRTRTRRLLRPPERGQKAGEPRLPVLPLHVPREGVVVSDLLVDLRELLIEAATLLLDLPQGFEEPLLARAPSDEVPLRRLRRVVHGSPHLGLSRADRGRLPRREARLESGDDPRVLRDLLPRVLQLAEEVPAAAAELLHPDLDPLAPLPLPAPL